MSIVDSSGWLAFFPDEPNAKHFYVPLTDTTLLVVPAVTIYEVIRVVLRGSSENKALLSAVVMQKDKVKDLTASLPLMLQSSVYSMVSQWRKALFSQQPKCSTLKY